MEAVLNPEKLPRGERHGRAKLTEALVKEIRHLYVEGFSQTALGHKLGVSHKRI